MTRFVATSRGYANLGDIDLVRTRRRNRYQFVVDGSVIDKNVPQFGGELTKIIPVTGEWECLIKTTVPTEAQIEPVIAWGFTVLGAVVPVTPSKLNGVEGKFALRRKGEETVYGAAKTYASGEEWLKAGTVTLS